MVGITNVHWTRLYTGDRIKARTDRYEELEEQTYGHHATTIATGRAGPGDAGGTTPGRSPAAELAHADRVRNHRRFMGLGVSGDSGRLAGLYPRSGGVAALPGRVGGPGRLRGGDADAPAPAPRSSRHRGPGFAGDHTVQPGAEYRRNAGAGGHRQLFDRDGAHLR